MQNMQKMRASAKRVLVLMDLTSLNDDDTESRIAALCRAAMTPFGHTAAVCVCPRFVPVARATLAAAGARNVKVATVANFPAGELGARPAADEVAAAVAAGADEVDVVFPYRALMAGNHRVGEDLVKACRRACGARVLLKVILETGVLGEAAMIRTAAGIAVDAGADFIKTSTGKTPLNATPPAVRVMLEIIRDRNPGVGCKPSGGIRRLEQAAEYLALADEVMGPAWAGPRTFRFGASGLLDDLTAVLQGKEG